jgi:hypothetical protein
VGRFFVESSVVGGRAWHGRGQRYEAFGSGAAGERQYIGRQTTTRSPGRVLDPFMGSGTTADRRVVDTIAVKYCHRSLGSPYPTRDDRQRSTDYRKIVKNRNARDLRHNRRYVEIILLTSSSVSAILIAPDEYVICDAVAYTFRRMEQHYGSIFDGSRECFANQQV